MLPYHAFYDTLAETGEVKSDEWHATIAGLVVLRLVNDWLDFADTRRLTQDVSFATARALIADLPPTQTIKPYLRRIMRAIESAEQTSFSVVKQPILRYTNALAINGRFSLAHDALLPLMSRARSSHNTEAIIKIALQIALMLRLMGHGEQAEEYYQDAHKQARAIGDYHAESRALTGLHRIAFARDNLNGSDTRLANIAKIADAANDMKLKCLVGHEMACMADAAGDSHQAVKTLETALINSHGLPRVQLEFMRADLSALLLAIGRVSESRSQSLILAKSTRSQVIRWGALHNLMCAATLENDWHSFNLYRRALAFAPLHAWGAVGYHYDAAKGLDHFGQKQEAKQEADKAAALAKQYGISNWHIS